VDTVIFDVASMQDFLARAKAAAHAAQAAAVARISFPSEQRLLYVLSDNRVRMLKAMAGARVMGVRELARRVGRDVRAVHADIRVLLDAGVIDRTDNGKLIFPYRHVQVQFTLEADSGDVPGVHPALTQRAHAKYPAQAFLGAPGS